MAHIPIEKFIDCVERSELIRLLTRHGLGWDERYVWD